MEQVDKFETLVSIMDRLRDPENGCPWDLEQSFQTLRSYLLEECYEVADALDQGDLAELREELGDLLFQVVFLSRLAKEQGAFEAPDVVRGIAEKMIRRHPHIFGDETAEDAETVLRNWEDIKRREKAAAGKPARDSVLAGIPASLPALMRAQRLGVKTSRVGFDWPDAPGVLRKVEEELGEVRGAMERGDREALEEELGDLLFSAIQLARRSEVDPERALQRANRKFERRFRALEESLADEGRQVQDCDLEALERRWQQVKRTAPRR